eukprot:TRINITY_DN5743_c0_g1_i1.p1 TRINITY_DN5743_c0_g1~~TRINITY_DN5743_c0_g1_i1.p1  ORF type:complete len:364 (+),score=62.40 TRINITY_DN5743_c0_g1_i1:905-1996(+)
MSNHQGPKAAFEMADPTSIKELPTSDDKSDSDSDLDETPDGPEFFQIFRVLGGKPQVVKAKHWSGQRRRCVGCCKGCCSVFAVIYAIAVTGVLGYYVFTVAQHYIDDQKSPSSGISYEDQARLNFPTVTVCQVYSSVPEPPIDLACEVYSRKVGNQYSNVTECTSGNITLLDLASEGIFYCVQYNANASDPIFTDRVGFWNSLDFYVRLYVDSDNFFNSASLILTPHNKTVTIDDLIDNNVFIAPGLSQIVSMQMLVRVSVTGVRQISWSLQVSSAPNSDFIANSFGQSSSVSYVSLSYNKLAIQTITEQYTYPMTSVLGDVAGTFGTLLGLDAMNTLFGLNGILLRRLIQLGNRRRGRVGAA